MALSLEAAKEMGRALGMSDTDIEGYKAQFDATDEDGGGTISNDELKTVLRKCGVSVTAKEVDRYIKEFDTDGDGVLDFGEFLTMMNKFNQGPSERDSRKAMFEVRRRRGRARSSPRDPLPSPLSPPFSPRPPPLTRPDARRQPRRPRVPQ